MLQEMDKPIGVFDSGLGGLTVLKALTAALPNENFIYLGDVARLPYGTKSASVVTRYANNCVRYLLARQSKLIVIACNTATATALDWLRTEYEIPLYGVIEPGVRAAISQCKTQQVLVLATASAVKSGAYPAEFLRQNAAIRVEQLACPLLVPLAEEGWFDHPVTTSVIQTYLARAQNKNYDTVVLGCTHYPLLSPSFAKALKPQIALAHGAALLAAEVKAGLSQKELLRPHGSETKISVATTDQISASVPLVHSLFGSRCEISLIDL